MMSWYKLFIKCHIDWPDFTIFSLIMGMKALKVNKYTFKGKQLCHFHFCFGSHLGGWLSILGRFHPPGKQTGSHENCLPFENIAKKDGGVLYILRRQCRPKPNCSWNSHLIIICTGCGTAGISYNCAAVES